MSGLREPILWDTRAIFGVDVGRYWWDLDRWDEMVDGYMKRPKPEDSIWLYQVHVGIVVAGTILTIWLGLSFLHLPTYG